MKRYDTGDDIIALASAPGIAAISVIRLSGPRCVEKFQQFFTNKSVSNAAGHTIHYGYILNPDGKEIDEVLVSLFRAPRSYTKEDALEISCHGSPYIVNEILQLFTSQGFRMANPGEFTLRAFLNGRFDLSQAEAVADLIASESSGSHQLAINQLKGGFSNEIQKLRQELIDFAALMELELDFSEEDVEFADRAKLIELVKNIQSRIKQLLESFRLGNAIKSGVTTVIAGRPNAGKSTLLNALLNEERAIVSEIAGTTRDTIEEKLNINGVIFRLIDTAGIRTTNDKVEKIGVQKTYEKIKESAILLYVFDVTELRPSDLRQDLIELSSVLSLSSSEKYKFNLICLANKMDLNPYTKPEDFFIEDIVNDENLITISAINGMNIPYLKNKLYETALGNHQISDRSIVSNARHQEALVKANKSLNEVLRGLQIGLTGDFIAIDLRNALYYLGLITGEVSVEDLLDSVFSRFCIGK